MAPKPGRGATGAPAKRRLLAGGPPGWRVRDRRHPEEGLMKDLAGKTAVVTGAASGIGLGIATALSQAGVKVMLCDIEDAALTKAVEGLKRTNADVDGVRADVSLKPELQAAANE